MPCRAVLCRASPLAMGYTGSVDGKRGTCRQLPLGAGDYPTCMSLPLSKAATMVLI